MLVRQGGRLVAFGMHLSFCHGVGTPCDHGPPGSALHAVLLPLKARGVVGCVLLGGLPRRTGISRRREQSPIVERTTYRTNLYQWTYREKFHTSHIAQDAPGRTHARYPARQVSGFRKNDVYIWATVGSLKPFWSHARPRSSYV